MFDYENLYPGSILIDSEAGIPVAVRFYVYKDGPAGDYEKFIEPVDPTITMQHLVRALSRNYGLEIKY